MSNYDDTNTFILFVNDKGDNPKRPDRKGKININGVEYKLSGWISTNEDGTPKLDKSGKPMLRGKVEPADENQARPAARQAEPAGDFQDDENIPF